MSSVPISMDNLELIVSNCAKDLLEHWAIESDLQENELADYAVMAAETATFVIDKFMGYMNVIMEEQVNFF
jgi:hypothetical protein